MATGGDARFCSDRCRMGDLGRWFRGDYAIGRPIEEDDLHGDAWRPPPARCRRWRSAWRGTTDGCPRSRSRGRPRRRGGCAPRRGGPGAPGRCATATRPRSPTRRMP
ncbi:MAG: DNA gyrase inhibitor YacG [Phycisphaerales bacterium]